MQTYAGCLSSSVRFSASAAHVATDPEAELIRGVEVTTAKAHDASELDAVLLDAPGDTYGDSAYRGRRPEGIIERRPDTR